MRRRTRAKKKSREIGILVSMLTLVCLHMQDRECDRLLGEKRIIELVMVCRYVGEGNVTPWGR